MSAPRRESTRSPISSSSTRSAQIPEKWTRQVLRAFRSDGIECALDSCVGAYPSRKTTQIGSFRFAHVDALISGKPDISIYFSGICASAARPTSRRPPGPWSRWRAPQRYSVRRKPWRLSLDPKPACAGCRDRRLPCFAVRRSASACFAEAGCRTRSGMPNGLAVPACLQARRPPMSAICRRPIALFRCGWFRPASSNNPSCRSLRRAARRSPKNPMPSYHPSNRVARNSYGSIAMVRRRQRDHNLAKVVLTRRVTFSPAGLCHAALPRWRIVIVQAPG
jgi:hypothetical protein